MPSVSDFIVDKATVRFGDESDPTEVVYRPSRLDADRTDRFFDALEHNDVLAAAYLLTGSGDDDALIVDWNVTGPLMGRRDKLGEDGEPVKDDRGRTVTERHEVVKAGETIPLDPEVMRFLNANVLIGIYGQIQEDAARLVSGFFGKTKTTSLNGSRNRS